MTTVAARRRQVVAPHLVLRRGREVLLGLRCGGGFGSGLWHLPSGHLEEDETLVEALAREAREETGIGLDHTDVRLVLAVHHNSDDGGRVALCFELTCWSGTPTNLEPDKCAELRWFSLSALPTARMVPYAAAALEAYSRGETYAEWGWG
jgi:8-oxo-dGTP diphosphatase